MNDNYFMDDLISSLEKDIVIERYYPLIDLKEELGLILKRAGAVRKNQVTDAVIKNIQTILGNDIAILFRRFIHIYDFNMSKLKELKEYIGNEDYDELASLMRLPGVRLLRASLYFNSGVTLKVLAEKSTEDVRNMVFDYIKRENRLESIPKSKEVNCHRAVAKMILSTDKKEKDEQLS